MTTDILVLSAREVEVALDLDVAMASQRAAFVALARHEVDSPPKIMHASRFDDSVVFGYLSRVSSDTGAVAKIGSVNPGNVREGLPSVSATVLVLHPVTGEPIAILDGTAVTTLRTAAASAVAAEALASPGASWLGVLGSGTQARAHVRALARVLPLEAVSLWSPTAEHRRAAADELAVELGIPVRPVSSARDAVTGMNIVVTCTLSHEPVVHASWLSAGCTVLSVGSFEPSRLEVGVDVVNRAEAVIVDDPATAAGHAGPIVAALAAGDLVRDDLIPLGAVLSGAHNGRTDPADVVFYNSVGLGVQDAAAAWAAIDAVRAVHEEASP